MGHMEKRQWLALDGQDDSVQKLIVLGEVIQVAPEKEGALNSIVATCVHCTGFIVPWDGLQGIDKTASVWIARPASTVGQQCVGGGGGMCVACPDLQ